MISNNTTYKLKASKSTREINNDYDNNHSDDNCENDSPDGGVEAAAKYQGYSRGDGRYNRGGARPRSSEFRSSNKINEKRGGYRGGRGGPSRARGDRDISDFYGIRKYPENTSRHLDSSGSFHAKLTGKLYENDKKNDVKLNLPEDTRISKLLRRLSNETDQDISLAISEKLLVVLLLPANSSYVRKAFHILGESMYEILQVSPGLLAKQQAAKALGRMGHIMAEENDFERYQTWVFAKLTSSNEEMQILLMKSFKETLELEKIRPFLENYAEILISNLVSCIEITENAEIFKIMLDILMSVAEIYPNSFYRQFQDTIDLLFGWHVDHTQPLANIEFISRNLQRISGHFRYNLEFSMSLIENFLEDVGNVLYEPNSHEHATVLILALNSVLKCLGDSFHPSNNKFVNNDFIISCLKLVVKTATESLDNSTPNNLIIVCNESVGLLLGHLDTKTSSLNQLIFNLMDLELSMITDLADSTVISLLLLISKIIKELSANLPTNLIETLIGPHSEIVKLRYSPFTNIRDSVICVYQALLNLKNVSLLQEAYRYVLGDLEVVYKSLVPNLGDFIQSNPFLGQDLELSDDLKELAILFLLRCLSQLANASSIIVMWALKPTILELIGVYLEPFNENLARKHPALQYSLLYLLYSHCRCYNHFISSSNLVTKKQGFALPDLNLLNLDDLPNTSPNLGNFEIILDILFKTLSIKTTCEVTLLMLQWLDDILVNSDNYLENLYNTEKFVPVTKVLVKCGYHFNTEIALAVCSNLLKLLRNKQLRWSNQFLISVCDLCKLHLNSNRSEVRQRYSILSANIPWDCAVVEFNKSNSVYDVDKKSANIREYTNYTVWMAQHLHLNNSVNGDIYPLQFKLFMDYLLKNETDDSNWLEDIFITSWPLRANYKIMDFFYDLATNSRTVLYHWSTLESAQFCVNCKLRTPLGKPNETFTKIEASLKNLGNDLVNLKKCRDATDFNRTDFTRVRLLLQFIEHLEKSIYNASEGCAVAMQQPPKQVRSFFIANANTCNEWLGRIRLVMVHVSMHAGDPSSALRHAQALLNDLVSSGKGDSLDFERALMFATLSLLSLKEPEAINGLYVWCKLTLSRKFPWIKCAADQAGKKYESAIEGYEQLLRGHRDDSAPLESDIVHFIEDQIALCYKELGNWVDLLNWHADNSLAPSVENGQKYWFSVTDWNCVTAIFNAEIGMNVLEDLSDWKLKPETWSKYENLTVSESTLYRFALDLSAERPNVEIDDNLAIIQKAIRDNLNEAPSEFVQNLLVMQYVNLGLKRIYENDSAQSAFLVSEDFEKEIHKIESSVLRKVLWWSEYFANVQNTGSTTFCTNLRLEVIKRARREKNFKLAFMHVNKFLKDEELLVDKDGIDDVAGVFLQKIKDVTVWSTDTARAITEIIKLSYGGEMNHQNTFNLCAAASTAISRHAELYGGPELKKLSCRILLKLANWLQSDDEASVTELDSPLGKLLMVLPDIGPLESSSSHVISLNEMAVGKLLQFAVHQCSSFAKSWNCFGAWCYRWGRKIVDQSADIDHVLGEDDCLAIKALLPSDVSKDDLNKIFAILSQTRSNIEEEDIESNDVSTSEIIKNQLRSVNYLRFSTENHLEDLVDIWRNTQKRIYTYYGKSAEAYFKYLQLSICDDDDDNEDLSENTEGNVITVTLRLLRLIVKYALELQNTLEEGLQTTPTQPWKVIIPQLFSRLNHPESYVRLRVSDLLCRIAEDAPHLITFPAVVGALEGGLKFDFSEISLPKDCLSQNNEVNNELDEDEYNYDSDHEEDTHVLQSCFKTMVDTLSKQDPETIAQVQSVVKELRRITLLWDELWLGTLAQHQTEITKRQQQLEYEIEKVNDNCNLDKDEKRSLVAEKHRIIIKPIVFVLEQLLDVTSVEAETPHEKQFQEKYLGEIYDVLDKLKNPEHPEKPAESLQPLKALQKHFQQKFHKRASYTLKMQAISPTLASIKNTMIAMPGLASSAKKAVTISHVSNIVSILPTKTKPKKLIFYGSDGQTYTYLFKGLEDLHLDERIMQFLSIANTMMIHNADSTGTNLYRARHYSVIPLGPRSGLISWVDGTTPAFALYKRWQQREIAKPTSRNSINTNSTTILRPSDLFYNKLNPLLKEHGVKNPENRKEWPLSVLKQVLCELMAETPSDLLAKELWCNSISASTWWRVVKRFSYSVAVMSIIGYIIGLGDRHLDNVLVDLTSGEVVHIDYNVCFEKGKTLRVPEKVPFRLTPNIRGALGVTGVEGIFRTACENVLRTMRKGRETLLTLLEAFVYDPLIDWTVGGEVLAGTTFGSTSGNGGTRQGKKDLEREVTLSMYNVRCTEMRVEWHENKEIILGEIPSLNENFKLWLDIYNRIKETEDSLQDLHQQMALVKEAEAHGANKHPLYTLPSRYEQYCKTQEAMKTAKRDLDKITREAEKHMAQYGDALKLLDGPQMSRWHTELKREMPSDSNIFDLVKEFLHNAGKNDVITQCEQSENDVENLSSLHVACILRCLQLLQDYHAILAQCPRSYMENHRMSVFLKWAKYMIDVETVDACDVVYENFQSFFDISGAKNTLQFSYALETLYEETVTQVNKLYEELAKVRAEESSSSLEQTYANARLGISNFLTGEKTATDAFEFVIVNELLVLNENFLQLETTASRSGELLIKLTSRDGDWFLDDLVLNSTRAVEMINNLPIKQNGENERFFKVLNGVRSANNVYKGLHELHFNFHTIILPESMKKIQNEETTVLKMIGDFRILISGLGATIPVVVNQLEKILHKILMQMDVNASSKSILVRVAQFRSKFQSLIETLPEAALSQGKMLLMGFNGLFEKLNQEMNNLIATLGDLDIPQSWKKLDQVKEAKNISAHIFDRNVYALLNDIFLLKRAQTMFDFFTSAQEMCLSFKQPGHGVVVYGDDHLLKPVRQFIADFISRQLLGICTESIAYTICCLLEHLDVNVTNEIEQKDIGAESKVPLDELCHKSWNYLLRKRVFTANVLSQASGFSNKLKSAWEKIQGPKKLELKWAMLQSSAVRMQTQLTVYNFVYEEILNQFNVYTAIRSKFIVDVKTEIETLRNLHLKLIESKRVQKSLIENAYQRLNWAKGANPNVVEICAAFESAVDERDERLDLQLDVAGEILSICDSILLHEVLRTHCDEAKNYDKLFINSFEKWRIACQYTGSKSEGMSSTEESIMNLLTVDLSKNPKWLDEISELISNSIRLSSNKLDDEKANLFAVYDALSSGLEKFKIAYSTHGRLMADVKTLVKCLAKIEDFSGPTQQYVQDYKKFIDFFGALFTKFKKDTHEDDVKFALEALDYISANIEAIYDGLLNLEGKNASKPQLTRQEGLEALNKPAISKQESMTKGQQRNAYAVGVWRRVKMKLEGRDPDPSRKCTPQEQVDHVIREATNLDNLALLYEGWTPWV